MTDTQQKSSVVGLVIHGLLALYAAFLVVYLILRFSGLVDNNLMNFLHTFALYLFAVPLIGGLITVFTGNIRLLMIQFLLVLMGVFWLGARQAETFFVDPILAEDSIVLMTFNMYPDNEQFDSALETIIDYNADVVLLQEANGDLAPIVDAYEFSYVQQMATGYQHGIFSRYPLKDTGLVDLDGMENQRAELVLPDDSSIAVYNLHLYMPLNEDESAPLLLRYDETRRNQQISELLSMVNLEDMPVILGGDFNMSEYSPIYNDLDAVLRDTFRETNYVFGFTFPAGAFEELNLPLPLLLRLDYVWTSDTLPALQSGIGLNLGSDHLPLIVEIAIPTQRRVASIQD